MFNPYKIAKLARGLIYLTLFLPLVMVPATVWEFIFVKSILFYVFSAILIFLVLIYLYKNKQNIEFKVNALFWLILIFVAVKILSGLLGIDPGNSFFGSMQRMDGNIGYLALLSWLTALLVFLDGGEAWRRAFRASATAALISGVFAIVQAFFPIGWGAFGGKYDTPFWSYRFIGTLGNPIFLAGYLLPHVFICLYLASGAGKIGKYFWSAAAAFLAFILFLTQTRGAMISFVLSFVLISVFSLVIFFKNRSKRFGAVALWALPFVAAAAVAAAVSGEFLKRVQSIFILGGGTAASRFLMWKIGIAGALARPVFGWGPENYTYILSKFYNPELLKYSFYETWADKPHNQFIEVAATSGAAGLLLFFGILIYAVYALSRTAWKSAAAARLTDASLSKALGKSDFMIYLLLMGAVLGFAGHVFFAFDTVELRFAMFLIFGYIIFASGHILGNAKKLSGGLIVKLAAILTAVSVLSFWAVGFNTIRAAQYTSAANDNLINNNFSASEDAFGKLKNFSTPYINGSWEYLADTVLKADAIGRVPRTVLADILPIVAGGLEKSASGNADNFSYHYRLAQMYNLMGTYVDAGYLDKALGEAETAKKISPKRQVSDVLIGQIYYGKRDLNKAIVTLEKLTADNPDSGEPLWFLGILYDAAGQYQKSYAAMTAAYDKGRVPADDNERSMYVMVLGRASDYARLAPIYEELTRSQPDNAEWWANLAATYLELKRYDDARKAARQAIFLSPQFGDEGAAFLKKVDVAEAAGK